MVINSTHTTPFCYKQPERCLKIVYYDVGYYNIGLRIIKNISSSTSHNKTPSLRL